MNNYIFQDKIDYILNKAPVNILYRTKKEILKESVYSNEMQNLQEQILRLPKVKKAFLCQRESGFFGSVLHGVYFDGFDSTVNLLKRNGVELTNPNMIRAREALATWKDYKEDHFYKAGNAMDEHGRGGFRAIWAEQLVELGADESLPQIHSEIENALAAFRGALNYSCSDDFSKKAKFNGQNCRYYIKGATFPAANHIKILEKTLSWRTHENIEMVKKSYWHCKDMMNDYNDGFIYVNCGYFVGPFNHNWNALKERITLRSFDSHPIDFAWFMKDLSSASVSYSTFDDGNPYFIDSLAEFLSNNQLIESISKEQLRQFKNYTSLAPSWRKKEHLICDIYFPLLLAFYHSKKL